MKIHIRSMIVAPKGKVLIAADLSQAESWIVAYLANEHSMKNALLYGDIHTESAGNALFFNTVACHHFWEVKVKGEEWICNSCGSIVTKLMRYVGKRYNHASAYRMGAERAAQVINKDSDKPPYFTVTIKQSKTFSASWHSYFKLGTWWGSIELQLRQNRTLITPYGRRRVFFANWGQELFKEATAFVPQSTVADHALGRVQKELGAPGGIKEIKRQLVDPYQDHRLVNFSHDSYILEVPKQVGEEMAQRSGALFKRPLVVNGEEFTIPVDLEIGERWTEMQSLKMVA